MRRTLSIQEELSALAEITQTCCDAAVAQRKMVRTMGFEYAIDKLYGTGWLPGDGAECDRHADGRQYPSIARVQREFAEMGHKLSVRYVELFDCYRAEWRDDEGTAKGAVVGQSEAEAVVYALAQLRRQLQVAVA